MNTTVDVLILIRCFASLSLRHTMFQNVPKCVCGLKIEFMHRYICDAGIHAEYICERIYVSIYLLAVRRERHYMSTD